MNIYIEGFGCTRRKLEVTKFHTYFTVNGFTIVREPEKADIILVATCAFKCDEEEASLAAIDQFGKYDAKKIIYGCLPAIAPGKYHSRYDYEYLTPKNLDEIDNLFEGITCKYSEIDDANLIDKDINYSPLSKAIKTFADDFELSVPFIVRSCRYVKNKYINNQKMYYLFASRGCLGKCSYCAVRFAVGELKSKPLDAVTTEFVKGIEAGHKHFSILGDDVGAYGQDRGSNICELMSALLAEIEKRKGAPSGTKVRLHVEEINPRWILRYEKELVDLLGNTSVKSILCPLQSGNARILELMNRGDDIDHLLTILNEVKKRNPKVELNTQIIVGFPSETESEFEESLDKLGRVAFNNVILFPFDDKENTEAFEIRPKVSASDKDERMRKAQALLRQKGIKTALSCNE